MKKFKIVPSLILLALCVAVLGIGIYAASPASNQITGTVTVTGANGQIAVSVYKNNVKVGQTETTRTGVNMSYGEIEFDCANAESPTSVPNQTIKITIQNNSGYIMKGYFWNKGESITAPDGDPTSEQIMTESYIKDSHNVTVVTATYSEPQTIAAGGHEDFTVTLKVSNFTEETISAADLDLYLVVYKYTPPVEPTNIRFSVDSVYYVADGYTPQQTLTSHGYFYGGHFEAYVDSGWDSDWDGIFTVEFEPNNVTDTSLTWTITGSSDEVDATDYNSSFYVSELDDGIFELCAGSCEFFGPDLMLTAYTSNNISAEMSIVLMSDPKMSWP